MEEKYQYEHGTESERLKIDELRKERQEFARKAMEDEERRSRGHFRLDDDDGLFSEDDFDLSVDEDFDFDFDESSDRKRTTEKRSRVDLSVLSKSDKEVYNLLKNMPPKEMAAALKERDGLMMFLQAFGLATAVEDGRLVVKLWDAAPVKVRSQAQKMFPAHEGSLKDIIEGLRFATQMDDMIGDFDNEDDDNNDNNNNDHGHDNDGDEENYNEDDDDKAFDDKGHRTSEKFVSFGKRTKKGLKPTDEALLKQIYRKLVRSIHPDSHHDQKLDAQKQQWFSKMWHEIQRAYQDKNVPALKRLEMIAIVRLQDLQSLTLDEISDSAKFFNQELMELKRNIKQLQQHPAWKFSGKKSYEALKNRIKKELRADLEPLYYELEELRELHAFFNHQYVNKGRKNRKNRTSTSKKISKSSKKSRVVQF